MLPQFLLLRIMVQSDKWRELFRCSFHELAEVGSVDRRQDLHVDQLPMVCTPYCVLVHLNHLGTGGEEGGKEKKGKNKQHTHKHTPTDNPTHVYPSSVFQDSECLNVSSQLVLL